jgi:hypothetical protein
VKVVEPFGVVNEPFGLGFWLGFPNGLFGAFTGGRFG